jgi:hypothetical protein
MFLLLQNHEESADGRCRDKSPLSDTEAAVTALNGNDFPLLKKKEITATDHKYHKSYIRPKDPTALSTGDISKKISHHPVRKTVNPPCYDNYGYDYKIFMCSRNHNCSFNLCKMFHGTVT